VRAAGPLVRAAPGAIEVANQETILTPEGLKKLTAELDELKAVGRKQVADRIRAAKQFGEIGENSEYEDAKAEQAQIEGRIETLQYLLQTAVIQEGPGKDGKIGVGSHVRLRDEATKEELEYHIVGALEADPAEHRISNQSPLGEALIGHSAGETVEVQAPGGASSYVILAIGD
jgi:transcription elongation factor GreA